MIRLRPRDRSCRPDPLERPAQPRQDTRPTVEGTPRASEPRRCSDRCARRIRRPGCSLWCKSTASGSTPPARRFPRTRRSARSGRRSRSRRSRPPRDCILRPVDRGSAMARFCSRRKSEDQLIEPHTKPRKKVVTSLVRYPRRASEARPLNPRGGRRRALAPTHPPSPRETRRARCVARAR